MFHDEIYFDQIAKLAGAQMWTNRQIWNGAPKDLDEEDSIGSYPRFAYRVVTQITQTTECDTTVTPLARVQDAPRANQ